jgi:hypothetical protein
VGTPGPFAWADPDYFAPILKQAGWTNLKWQVVDADQGAGITDFAQKGELWKARRALAKNFWTD